MKNMPAKKKNSIRLLFRAFLNKRSAVVARVVIILALLNVIYPQPRQVFAPLKEGDIAQQDMVAPFTFPIQKDPEQLKKERRKAIESVLPIIDYDEKKTEGLFGKVEHFFALLYETKEKSLEKRLSLLEDNGYSVRKNTLLYFLRPEIRAKEERMKEIFFQALEQGIIFDKREIPFSKDKRVLVRRASGDEIYSLKDFLSLDEVKEYVRNEAYASVKRDEDCIKAIDEIMGMLLAPNLRLNIEETEKRRREASASVAETKGIVLKGEMIVRAHDQITKDVALKLNSLNALTEEKKSITEDFLRRVGLNILLILLLLFLYFYISRFKPNLWKETEKLLAIEVVLLGFIYLSSLLFKLESTYLLLIPASFLAVAFTMLFGGSFGMVFSFILVSIIAVFAGMRFPAFIFLMLSCIAGTYSVRGIKRRAQLYRTLLIVAAANLLLAFGIGAFGRSSIFGLMLAAGFGIANAIVSVSLVTVLLPLLERVTETTSNITLFEWSDLNLPLLKKLSVEAPGTYNHSIIVGNLAEAAAEAIGANSTLARVASYYHDIGKMLKPEYFIENQMGIKNPHAKLKPQLSCIILISHVKEGNEIAQKARLPGEIIRIIREHHGTSLIVPFYEKAKKLAENGTVDESQFRYPGPLPSSKESGIVMIADSVEAAARSLEEPTAKRLKSIIGEIIEERFLDGQLNRSQLTLVDLMKIGESFLPILVGMHHLRVEYP
jgi:putative nucleotidyltransferase with HDIG domain